MPQRQHAALPLHGPTDKLTIMSLTFATSVWENDWEYLLKTDRLERAIARCGDLVTHKTLIITNVLNPIRVAACAERLVQRKIIDRYHFADDHADEALKALGVSRESTKIGYYYSIADYVSIYQCHTKYLLQFKGDSWVAKDAPRAWLAEGLQILQTHPQVKVFNLIWNFNEAEARAESFASDDRVYFGFGFSDQMYLVRSADFKAPIYGESNPESERYPLYGGQLFEKRVDSWMRNHRFWRATSRHGSYLHKNFPRSYWQRKLGVTLERMQLVDPMA